MEAQIQQSWFKRNWKWFVPTLGCGTIIILFVVLAITVVSGVSNLFTNSEPSQYAFDLASKNERVIEVIGVPIEKDGIAKGNFQFSDSDGSAIDMQIPIKGPKGSATLVVVGNKYEGEDWSYSELHIIVSDSQEKIELKEN